MTGQEFIAAFGGPGKVKDLSSPEVRFMFALAAGDREAATALFENEKQFTGLSAVDQKITGLNKSDLILLAARPGMGKTSFALNIAINVAKSYQKTVAVFSLEMPRSEIVQRLICAYANVSMKNALSGELSAKEWKKLMLAGDKL